VQLRYLSLSAEAIAPTLEISEQTVRERYDQRASGSGEDAARSVRHILAAVPEDGDEAAVDAARQTIVEARERIRAGESFAAVAEAVSDDSGSAGRGGSLGVIEQSDVADAFAETAWSLQPGDLSQPVRTPFGWHLIEVTDAQAADLPPFEQMRASIRETIAMERAERRVTERANTLETLAFENPLTLEPAADAAGLSVQSTDWIDASADDTGIAGDSAVLETAFSDAMLDNRENSDLIELEDGGYAVIRVTDYRSARIRPLDAVRDQAVSAYRDQRANAAARADAQRIADAVNAGESPETAASGIDAAQLNAPVMGGRNDRSLPAGVRERGFRLSGPDGSGDRAGVGRLSTGWAAVVVESVEPGDPAAVSAERRDQLRQTLTDLDGQASVQAVVAALRAQADVEIREGNL